MARQIRADLRQRSRDVFKFFGDVGACSSGAKASRTTLEVTATNDEIKGLIRSGNGPL
jgi:hypothetical protein